MDFEFRISDLSTRFLQIFVFVFALGFLFLAVLAPLSAGAQTCDKPGGLVPCGRLCDDPSTPRDEKAACQICDFFELIDRIWKFVLTVLVPGVAIVLYIAAGILILLYGANPGLQSTGKNIFKTTTWGVIIIFAAWMLTNTVMRSLAGDSLNPNSRWYEIQCGNPTGAPPPSTQRYSCGSTGCVARSDGQYDSLTACQSQCSVSGDACDRPQVLAQQHNNAKYPCTSASDCNAPELNQLIACIRGQLPGVDLGSVFTFDQSRPFCNYTRGDRHCTGTCSHSNNSCHYGGSSGTQGSLAVDFGNERMGNAIINAAYACGAKPNGARCETSAGVTVACSDSRADHVHVTSRSCDRN